ncbi:hypothetical protein [Blastomonas sp. CCH1-A6]|jgi:hypothetical protein|uniref:hypothetical protein n=1 Tax=Blastomonas sp. CCH1-A6 TaxID=1768762 RepID=UPI000833D4DA
MSKVLKIAATVVAVAGIIVATGGAASFGLAGALSTTIAGTAISAGALLTVAHAIFGRACLLVGEALA